MTVKGILTVVAMLCIMVSLMFIGLITVLRWALVSLGVIS